MHFAEVARLHAHNFERFFNRAQQLPHHAFIELADTSDTEAFGFGELARIDDEVARFQFIIETPESEFRISGAEKGCDDRREPLIFEQSREAKRATSSSIRASSPKPQLLGSNSLLKGTGYIAFDFSAISSWRRY